MVYDETNNLKLIADLDAKERELQSKISDIRVTRSKLSELLDIMVTEKNADGSDKYGTDGKKIIKKSMPMDKGTEKPMDIVRRNEIFDIQSKKAITLSV